MKRSMPNTTRHDEAERTFLFPFDPSSLLATLADAWANGQQRRTDGLSWRERRAPRKSEQPVNPSDAQHAR
jgi:hypothetical protein